MAHRETWHLPVGTVDCQDDLHCTETDETRVQDSVR